jgi:hypothetical protein
VQTLLRVGDLEMDLIGRTVHRAGQEIDLQPREFQLLEFLMRHAGQSVTRTMLLEKVWEYHFDPQTTSSTCTSPAAIEDRQGLRPAHAPDRARRGVSTGGLSPRTAAALVPGREARELSRPCARPLCSAPPPFRLTLLFLALFAAGAGAFLIYIYLATAAK